MRHDSGRALAIALLAVFFPVCASAQTKVGSEFRINTYTSNNQSAPTVASDGTGNFFAAWQSSGQDGSAEGIYGQRYNSSGTPLGSEFRINTTTSRAQDSPSVCCSTGGSCVVVWEGDTSASGFNIYGQRFDSGGSATGGEFQVNTYSASTQTTPSVACGSGGGFTVVWASNGQDGSGYGVYGQRYSSTGSPAGSELRANTYTSSDQSQPAIAIDGSGNSIVVWVSTNQVDNRDVFAQRYNPSGTPIGSEFRVNTYVHDNQTEPAVAADGTGNFVVLWEGPANEGSAQIYGQRYDTAGNPMAGEFLVSPNAGYPHKHPSVSYTADGGFLATWTGNNNQDGSADGVYGRVFDSTGAATASEFQVNTTTGNDQQYSKVAALPSGNFAILWQSNAQDGSGLGVYGQRFNYTAPTPTPTATPTPTFTPTATPTSTPTLTPTQVPTSTATPTATLPPTSTPTPTSTSTTIPTATSTPPNPVSVTITYPPAGSFVPLDRVTVKGVFAGPSNTGVTVSGVVAATTLGAFTAVDVPLAVGQNSLTATAITLNGYKATNSVTVTSQAAHPDLTLTASPVNGVAPTDVEFSYSLDTQYIASSVTLDFDGDGVYDFASSDPSVPLGNTYTAPGLHEVRLTVIDTQGHSHTATTTVEIIAQTDLDSLLTTTWNDFRNAIRSGNLDSAITRIALVKQAAYRQMLATLGSNAAQINQILPPVSFVELRGDRAEYQMLRLESGVEISHFVLFVREDDGVWRIKFF